MTILLKHGHRIPKPEVTALRWQALQDAAESVAQTLAIQFDLKLNLDGAPGEPDEDQVVYSSTVALTNDAVNYQLACAFTAGVAQSMTRSIFEMDSGSAAHLADMGDALTEIPNVAAGVWKVKREQTMGESYQLGLPVFLTGNQWIKCCPGGANAIAQRLAGPRDLSLQVILVWQ